MEKNIWQAYKDKGVKVIGLNVWEKGDTKKVKDFVSKHKLTYLVLIDKDEKVFAEYTKPGKPEGVPTNAVIDKKGNITYLGAGFDETALKDAVDKALK